MKEGMIEPYIEGLAIHDDRAMRVPLKNADRAIRRRGGTHE